MEHLIIRLLSGGRAQWMLRDMQGETLNSIPQAEQQRNITVLIPGEDVLLTHIAVPARQRKLLRQTLPFLVEEKLAEDVTQLHIVAGSEQNGLTPVAVTRVSQMEAWLDALNGAQIVPDSMLPDTLALPNNQDEWQLLCEDGIARLRLPGLQGSVVEYAMLPQLLESCLSATTGQAIIQGYVTDVTLLPPLDDILRRYPQVRIQWHTHDLNAFAMMANTLSSTAAASFVNLLQGPYQPLRTRTRPVWREMAAVVALWFVAQMLIDGGQAAYLTYKSANMRAQSVALYQHSFPQDTKIINPVQQMKAHLSQPLAGDTPGLLPLLGKLAARWSPSRDTGAVQMQGMAYRQQEHQLTLSLSARTLEALNALAQNLDGGGLAAKVISVTHDKDGVKGQIIVQEASL